MYVPGIQELKLVIENVLNVHVQFGAYSKGMEHGFYHTHFKEL